MLQCNKEIHYILHSERNRIGEIDTWPLSSHIKPSCIHVVGRIKQRPSELVLSNTVTDDSGLYQCMTRNKVGESWVAGRLLVNMSRFQPEPPQGLTCRTLSDSLVKLEWQEPAKSVNNITAYTIHYLPTGEKRSF
ncbi:Protogenin [Zootermopsis nevadensis]|uniref:Protogenin n=1 Tax=Zootermopsis nevadensis TaxID=136037 RepID=A0A067RHI2_ZOONE|nr:Protogenin [Zootermopsis nevadensis]